MATAENRYSPPPRLPLRVSTSAAVFCLFLALSLLLFALLRSRQRRSSQAKTVLLIGPSGSGKTALFCRLVYAHTPTTFTSAAENEGHVHIRWHGANEADFASADWPPSHLKVTPPLHLIDVPGHPRLRTRKLALSLPAAQGVVLTTTTDLRSTREAADHMLLLFALLSVRQARQPKAVMPKLLIFVTKSDLLPSTGAERAVTRVQNALQREFERRKADAAVASGARLEGLEAPQTSSGLSNLFKSSSGAATDLPLDEVELFNSEVAAEMPDWETLGVKVSWASGNSTTPTGVSDFWNWADALL